MTQISFTELDQFVHTLLKKMGMSSANARIMTDIYISTTKRGVGHHDIHNLPQRLQKLKNGELNPNPEFRLLSSFGGMERYDGDNGPGELINHFSMERAMATFEKTYSQFPQGSIRLYTGQSTRPDMERELFADVRLAGFPARQFQAILNDLSNVLGTYDKLNHRNKKDENHLNKHAMHLLRLYFMAEDILSRGEIITYREKEHDFLMSCMLVNYIHIVTEFNDPVGLENLSDNPVFSTAFGSEEFSMDIIRNGIIRLYSRI